MQARRNVLYGILNGLDYEEYNPLKDPYIEYHFSKDDMANKRMNKIQMQKNLGLPISDDTFMIGIVSRMTDQKGFDLIAYVMEEMLNSMDVQFAVLGTGEARYEDMFRYFQDKYPDKVHAYIGYSEERANQIYAACDAFLMPSLFEPCGLSQLMSMRYGTLPIVRETGGLKDTVEPYNEFENTGTGFSFKEYNAHDMLHVIRYAYEIYNERPEQWKSMMKRAMEQDFSWNASAREYEKMYEEILAR